MSRSGTVFPSVSKEAQERLNEVAQILALGIFRLRAREETKNTEKPEKTGQFGVDFGAGQSVCGSEPENNGECV